MRKREPYSQLFIIKQVALNKQKFTTKVKHTNIPTKLNWNLYTKVIQSAKHSSLLGHFLSYEENEGIML